MNLEQIKEKIEAKAPPYLKGHPFLDAAILWAAEEKMLGERFMPDIIKRAGSLYESYIPPAKESAQEGTTGLVPTTTDFLVSDALVKALAPLVESLREEIATEFGYGKPPFESVGQAAAWVEDQSEKDGVTWKAQEGLEEAQAEIKAKEDELLKLASRYRMDLATVKRNRPLCYQRPDSTHQKSISTIKGTFLRKLAEETHRVRKHTGIAVDAATIHVLTGLKPLLPRARVKRSKDTLLLPNGERLRLHHAEVQFFAKNLKESEVRKVHSGLRQGVGLENVKELTSEHEDFLYLMEEIGPPPQKGKGKYWEEARRRWNEIAADKGYGEITTRRGVEKKYERLNKKLPT